MIPASCTTTALNWENSECVRACVQPLFYYYYITIMTTTEKVLLKSNAGYLSYVIFTRELNKDFELLN